jgi:hypothetical protein
VAKIIKIVSGGQTGVDRAAFNTALKLGIDIGGWVPRNRQAEDGRISDKYSGLRETTSGDPAKRTWLNVRDSDGTLIISRGPLSGGSRLTLEFAEAMRRPCLHLDLTGVSETDAAALMEDWVETNRIEILNIAGPRASEDPDIDLIASSFLHYILRGR